MNGEATVWAMWILGVLLAIIGFGLAGWSAYLMTSIRKNTKDIVDLAGLIAKHELEDARTYTSKQDFKETVFEVKDTLKRLYEQMDQINRNLINYVNNREK